MSAKLRRGGRPFGSERAAVVGAALVALALGSACQFDTSGLSGKLECAESRDCLSGELCVSGRCTAAVLGDLGDDLHAPDFGPFDPDAGDLADGTVPLDGGGDGDGDGGEVNPDCAGEENPCGGCEDLEANPGDVCGGACGSGVWVCAGLEALFCESNDATLNACGGCGTLEGGPGQPCSACDVWRCSFDGESVVCADRVLNACGGCAELGVPPGDSCGRCGLDVHVCDPTDPRHNRTVCSGDTRANECGGCRALTDLPGAPCGSCGLDEYACDASDPGDDATVCSGDTRANACGGCLTLTHAPGTPCGRCGLDRYVCDGADATVCDGDTAGNACGGCGTLLDPPGAICGPCSLDRYACDESDSTRNTTVCDGATYGNACGGCGTLLSPVGTPCGPCNLDAYVCNLEDASRNSTVCGGSTLGNACGGCTVFSEIPGTVCSCGGQGDAVWVCAPSNNAVVCTDGDGSIAGARRLGSLDEDGMLQHRAWLDGTNDIDVFYVDAIEDRASRTLTCDVSLLRHPAPGTGAVAYQVFALYRYNDARQGNIVPYGCGLSDECYHYDHSATSLLPTSCELGSAGFDPAEDLYGCRESDALISNTYIVGVHSIDGQATNDTGRCYIVVLTTANGAPGGCEEYTLTVSF
jgi:hypothetical protein